MRAGLAAVAACLAILALAAGGRYKIVFNALSNDADQQRQALVRRLAAKDSSIDIAGMDVVWTAEFAEAGWIKPWPAFEAGKAAFEVNYPFIYPSAKEGAPQIFKQLAWKPYPAVDNGKPAKAPIGGVNLGVGAYTNHPAEAVAA